MKKQKSRKRFVFLMPWLLLSGCVSARDFSARLELEAADALTGQPVAGAEIIGGWQVQSARPPYAIQEQAFKGRTDAAGRFTAQAQTRGRIRYMLTHPAYHTLLCELAFWDSVLEREETLKPKVNPVPMIFHRDLILPVPVQNKTLRFDLVKLDWLPPYGEGEVGDLQIKAFSRTEEDAYQSVVNVRFAGQENGIQPFSNIEPGRHSRSTFDADYQAPLDGYRDAYVFELSSGVERLSEDPVMTAFYFRIRSRRDTNGQIQGLYGRLYGKVAGLGTDGPVLNIRRIYVQPRYNSRNMEFDGKTGAAEPGAEHPAGQ